MRIEFDRIADFFDFAGGGINLLPVRAANTMKRTIYFTEYYFEPVNEEKSLLLWDGGACNALSALHVATKKYNGIKKRLILLGKKYVSLAPCRQGRLSKHPELPAG